MYAHGSPPPLASHARPLQDTHFRFAPLRRLLAEPPGRAGAELRRRRQPLSWLALTAATPPPPPPAPSIAGGRSLLPGGHHLVPAPPAVTAPRRRPPPGYWRAVRAPSNNSRRPAGGPTEWRVPPQRGGAHCGRWVRDTSPSPRTYTGEARSRLTESDRRRITEPHTNR